MKKKTNAKHTPTTISDIVLEIEVLLGAIVVGKSLGSWKDEIDVNRFLLEVDDSEEFGEVGFAVDVVLFDVCEIAVVKTEVNKLEDVESTVDVVLVGP